MLHVPLRSPPQDDRTAAAWQAALGISSPPASGTMVFLRGPGATPRTLAVPPGSAPRAADLQQLIDSNGTSLTSDGRRKAPCVGAAAEMGGTQGPANTQTLLVTTHACITELTERRPWYQLVATLC